MDIFYEKYKRKITYLTNVMMTEYKSYNLNMLQVNIVLTKLTILYVISLTLV